MPVKERELPPTDEEGEVILPSGDTIHPNLFSDIESTLEEHRGGEEGWRNRFNVKDDDEITPFTTAGSFTVSDVAGARHKLRSRRARTADESFNAPIAPDYATWRANPNRYDLPGVDTIPDERLASRAEGYLSEAKEAGLVESFSPGAIDADESQRGGWAGPVRHILSKSVEALESEPMPHFRYGPVLAHEVGHAVDYGAAEDQPATGGGPDETYYSEVAAVERRLEDAKRYSEGARRNAASGYDVGDMGLEPQLLDELWGLTRRARGHAEPHEGYRGSLREVAADALSLRRLEPRAVKREAPRAYEWLGNLEREAFEGEASD